MTDGEGVVVEGEGASELAADETNLAVRAYALLADPSGKRFAFVNRIPLERGLGSSAAAIALGLVAAAPEAARGGAARGRAEARAPRGQPRRGAARRAHALLGRPDRADRGDAAARARRGDPARADVDRELAPHAPRHGPALRGCCERRAGGAPRRGGGERRRDALRGGAERLAARALPPSSCSTPCATLLPGGCSGATLSGSGPTVIAWCADPEGAARELAERFPDYTVLRLEVTPRGAL